jgi:phenylalanyl-tRNA synthetase beta chain
VDYDLPLRASAKAVGMLAELGGGTAVAGYSLATAPIEPVRIVIRADLPDRVAGTEYGADTVIGRLREVGCEVDRKPDGLLAVQPPSWRPDLTDPNDLAEEVIRLEGYDRIGVTMPHATAGKGRTATQRLRISIGHALAGAGYVEVVSSPFGSESDFERMQLARDDERRRAVRLSNPIRDEEPLMRTTLLPGLFRVVNRNAGRGFADLALFEIGHAFRIGGEGNGHARGTAIAPVPAVDHGPTPADIAALDAALPDQPRLAACVLTGRIEPAGWWGEGRQATLYDAIEAAHAVLRTSRLPYRVRAANREPWHPGRCAEFVIDPPPAGLESDPGSAVPESVVVGYAGELHPRVVSAFKLAPRTCAMELDLSVIEHAAAGLAPVQAPVISGYPMASQDVALVVDNFVPAADVEAALVAGAAASGTDALLEQVRLFDVYSGEQTGAGRKSLAYTLRFRALDRTLTDDEVAVARDAAVAEAARRTGAVLRSG